MSDRCRTHKARACRKCDTSEHLDAAQRWYEAEDRVYEWLLDRAPESIIDAAALWSETLAALKAERAAHATTKAERDAALDQMPKPWERVVNVDDHDSLIAEADESLARIDVLAAKVARIENLLLTADDDTCITAVAIRVALAGDE